MKYSVVNINLLKPIEKVFPTHLKNLEKIILEDGFIIAPIIADKKTGAVMDGSHRYAFFLRNGFKTIPVFWSDYDDENVRVGTSLSHRFLIKDAVGINKEECRSRALSGNLFDPRTTRHFFTFRKEFISLPLKDLEVGEKLDITHLIFETNLEYEIEHNLNFINEIDDEINIIVQYLEEISSTKRYLLNQVHLMDSRREVGFFPGKFHPPHIGQIQTILSLIPKYRKLIIGVSEHIPEDGAVVSVDEIITSLTALFKPFKNVELCLIKGVLINKTDLSDLPKFDVLLSGNQDVIEWATRFGVRNKYVDRSFSSLCSGTEVRKIIRNNGL